MKTKIIGLRRAGNGKKDQILLNHYFGLNLRMVINIEHYLI